MAEKPTREELEEKVSELEQAHSELKRIKETLHQSEEKYRLLAEYSADVIYTFNLETEKCTYASPTVEKLLGYKADECISLNIEKFLSPESYAKQKERLLQALENGSRDSEVLELEVIQKNGHILPMEINVNFILDELENPVGVLGVARDISKQKQMREDREKLIRELQEALKEIKTLRGILPICSICKSVRDDKGYWEQVDVYIQKHSQADISHCICPQCAKELYPNFDLDEE